MKTRRIPPTAEKVYTYTLNRSANNESKPTQGSSRQHPDPKQKPASVNQEKPLKQVNQHNTGTHLGKSRERAENKHKSGEEEILAWGNTDEETQAFYDEMLEHESGDGEHSEEKNPSGENKPAGNSTSGYAKNRFLNTPHEGDTPPKNTDSKPATNTGKFADDRFLEGDQDENKTTGYEA